MSEANLQQALARRVVAVTAYCLLPTAHCPADTRYVENDDNDLRVIQMEVTPADEPEPAFAHRLTFGPHERVAGNRPQWYVRSFPENTATIGAWRKLISGDDYDDYYRTGKPIGELDLVGFAQGVKLAQLIDDHVVPGAQRRDCDWGVRTETLTGPDTFQFLLPEFQAIRELSRMTSLMTRQAIAERRYDDAIAYLRAHLQMGRDVGAEPLIVPGLIGIAICGIAHSNVEDLVAAPGSPNLYWALTELPPTPAPMGDAIRNELTIGQRLFSVLEGPEDANRTPEEWNALWKQQAGKVGDWGVAAGSQDWVDAQTAIFHRTIPVLTGLSGYSHAKSRLVDWGYEPDRVEAMAVGQVLALYSSRVYRVAADTTLKAYLTPFPQRRRTDAVDSGPDRELIPIASIWLPATQAARTAEVRTARDLAALRVIEALRMHAAQNDGRWPVALEDVTCVPVPNNPATDKPFLYHREGPTAVLDLPDWEGFPGGGRRYEITIPNP